MEIGGSSVLIETHVNTHMAFEKNKYGQFRTGILPLRVETGRYVGDRTS